MRFVHAAAVVLIVGVLTAGCSRPGAGPGRGGGSDAVGAGLPCVVTITVKDNALSAPDRVKCAQDGDVLFVFVNNDRTHHEFTIDPNEFVDKTHGNEKKNPLTATNPIRRDVPGPGAVSATEHVKRGADYATYKYTVKASGCPDLDPEIEIAM